jgi:hypothetical protein
MKKIFLLILSLCTYGLVLAQDNPKHMAFYGVDYDTARSGRDTLFRLDSSHINLYVCGGFTFNTALKNLIPDPYAENSAGGLVAPTYMGTLPIIGSNPNLTFGFEYLSRESKKHFMYSLGLEAFFAKTTGNIKSNTVTTYITQAKTDSVVMSGVQYSPYSISVFAISVPFKFYYVFSERKNHRMSAGLGLTLGYYVYQDSWAEWYLSQGIFSFQNLATASIKYDFSIKRKTGMSIEPYFSMQMLDSYTHLMFLGVKVASL